MKKVLFYAYLAIVTIACTKSDNITTLQEHHSSTPTIVYASIDGQTRTELHWDDQNPKNYWSVSDKIAVFNQQYTYSAYQLVGDNITRNGEFELIEDSALPSVEQEADFTFYEGVTYAFYPYNNSLQLIEDRSDEDKKYLIYLAPGVQQFVADNSFGREASPMLAIAQADSHNYSFKNIFGYLKITLKGEDVVKNIELFGNNNETIAGRFPVTLEGEDTYKIIIDDDDNSEDCLKSIILECGNDGVALNNDGVSFIFALPPKVFDCGFTIIVTNSNGKKYKMSTNNEIEITRNHIKVMQPLTAEFELWPQIEYIATAQVGSLTNIYDENGDGLKCTEITYDEITQKGTISFNGRISKIGDYSVFSNNDKSLITSIHLPDGITLIGYGSLGSLTKLTSINIPQSVLKIDNSAFADCISLQSITIPSACTYLGTTVFRGCKSLTEATINSESLTMYDSVFGDCSMLKSVTFNSNTPPVLYTISSTPTTFEEIFDGCHEDLIIYVPLESIDDYRAKCVNETFANKIQAIK